MSIIQLKSSDGELFPTEIEVAKCFGAIKTMLEDCGMDDGEGGGIVPLPNVNANILRRIIQWATHHKNDVVKADDAENKEKRTNDISPWDLEFFKVDQGTLFELISAANYLDAKGLLDAACTMVANMMKGKTPDEIRETFNITNDLNEAETEQIRMESEWCEEK